jgi:hypothetical protein
MNIGGGIEFKVIVVGSIMAKPFPVGNKSLPSCVFDAELLIRQCGLSIQSAMP